MLKTEEEIIADILHLKRARQKTDDEGVLWRNSENETFLQIMSTKNTSFAQIFYYLYFTVLLYSILYWNQRKTTISFLSTSSASVWMRWLPLTVCASVEVRQLCAEWNNVRWNVKNKVNEIFSFLERSPTYRSSSQLALFSFSLQCLPCVHCLHLQMSKQWLEMRSGAEVNMMKNFKFSTRIITRWMNRGGRESEWRLSSTNFFSTEWSWVKSSPQFFRYHGI